MAPLVAAAIIGAGASLAGAGINAYTENKAAEAERESRERAAKELKDSGQLTQAEYDQVIQQIRDYYDTRPTLGQESDVQGYRDAIQGYNPEDFVANFGDFDFGKTKEDFVNPYFSQIIGDTRDQIQHTAAGAGLGRGTGAALNIAQGVAQKEDELYRTAMQDYQNERDFAYRKYSDAITNNQRRLDALRQGTQYKLGLRGDLANDYLNTQDAQMQDILKAQQDKLAAKQAYDTSIAGLY